MAATELPRNPLHFATKFVGMSLVSVISILILTSPIFLAFYFSKSSGILFLVMTITSFAILVTHDSISGKVTAPNNANYKKLVMMVIGIVHYNLSLVFAWAIAIQIAEVSSTLAIFVAVLVPFWERISIKHVIPLSVGGILVWIVTLLYLMSMLGSRAINAATQSDVHSTALSAAQCLESSESWFINNRRFKRLN